MTSLPLWSRALGDELGIPASLEEVGIAEDQLEQDGRRVRRQLPAAPTTRPLRPAPPAPAVPPLPPRRRRGGGQHRRRPGRRSRDRAASRPVVSLARRGSRSSAARPAWRHEASQSLSRSPLASRVASAGPPAATRSARVGGGGGNTGIGFCLGGRAGPLISCASSRLRRGRRKVVRAESKLGRALLRDDPARSPGRRAARALEIDTALWDLKGKRVALPLARLLSVRREEVPAYASEATSSKAKACPSSRRRSPAGPRTGMQRWSVSGVWVEEHRATTDDPGHGWRPHSPHARREQRLARRADRAAGDPTLRGVRPRVDRAPISADDVDGHRRLTKMLDTTLTTSRDRGDADQIRAKSSRAAANVIQVDAAI